MYKINRHLQKFCKRYEEIENFREAISSPEPYQLHHRMEIQPDGTILSREWMKEHGIYYHLDPCMLIFLTTAEHRKLHTKGENHPLFGKHHNAGSLQKMSEVKIGAKNPFWKGDNVTPHGRMMRERRAMKRRLKLAQTQEEE